MNRSYDAKGRIDADAFARWPAKQKKAWQRAQVRDRAERALADLYHNATPSYPRDMHGRTADDFQSWFEGAAEFEIDYLQGGGAYGTDYRKTLAAECNAGRYKSAAAREYYVAKGMRAMRAERAKCAAWERIEEYGDLYQYGRGGRTLAPDGLYSDRRGGKWYPAEHSIADCVELIRIVESFNRYVARWCADVPELWREHCADEDAQALAEKRAAAARKAKETRERRYWEARDVCTI